MDGLPSCCGNRHNEEVDGTIYSIDSLTYSSEENHNKNEYDSMVARDPNEATMECRVDPQEDIVFMSNDGIDVYCASDDHGIGKHGMTYGDRWHSYDECQMEGADSVEDQSLKFNELHLGRHWSW
eukprot:Sro516_g158470.2  (125) ;mRNA; f:17543-17917